MEDSFSCTQVYDGLMNGDILFSPDLVATLDFVQKKWGEETVKLRLPHITFKGEICQVLGLVWSKSESWWLHAGV